MLPGVPRYCLTSDNMKTPCKVVGEMGVQSWVAGQAYLM